MPKFLVPPVVTARIGAQQPLHSRHQVGLRRLDYQVKMIAHQAVRMHLPAGLLTGLAQRFQQPLPVRVVGEDGFPPVAAIHHMVNRSGVLDA